MPTLYILLDKKLLIKFRSLPLIPSIFSLFLKKFLINGVLSFFILNKKKQSVNLFWLVQSNKFQSARSQRSILCLKCTYGIFQLFRELFLCETNILRKQSESPKFNLKKYQQKRQNFSSFPFC